MIARRTSNEDSQHIFPYAFRSGVCFLPSYSSFGVDGACALIRVLVRSASPRSLGVIYLGRLSERRKGGQDGAAYERNCQRLPNVAKKNGVFFFCLSSSSYGLARVQVPRAFSLEKSRSACYEGICRFFCSSHVVLREFLFNVIWENVWREP